MPLSLQDIRHLEAAEGWLERGDYSNCFDELLRIDNRDDARVDALRWRLYNDSRQHVMAASLALIIQRRYPGQFAGYIWRSLSLEKLGCYQEAYENLKPVAFEFSETGLVPFFLAVFACELGNLREAEEWLAIAFEAPDARELNLRALEEKSLEPLRRKIGQL
jgi:hypothetical protein